MGISKLLIIFSIFLGYHALAAPEFSQSSRSWWTAKWDNLNELMDILQSTPRGRHLVGRLGVRGARIEAANASITETTYSRSYSVATGQESFSVEQKILVSQKLSRADAVVDLAHELTHYLEREMDNPYEMRLDKKSFILKGIEGRGGELDAFQEECLVAWEFEKAYATFPEHSLCKRYKKIELSELTFDRKKARKAYYALGAYYFANEDVLQYFPESSSDDIEFSSSFVRLPYPIALAQEYENTMRSACKNNERRAQVLKTSGGRMPASLSKNLQKCIPFTKAAPDKKY